MRITFFDTERAPPLGWFWGLGEQRIHYGQIVQHGFFTSVQWQYEGDKVREYSLLNNKNFDTEPMNDKPLVEKMREIIANTDVLVAHNGKRFDWPEFKGRLIYHRIPMVRKPHIFDTLNEARSSSFISNKLGDLANHLHIVEKLENPTDFGKLVFGTIKERKEELKKSIKYGLGDIPPLRELFHLLHPYSENKLNIASIQDPTTCPRCGGDCIIRKGKSILVSGMCRNSYKCKCGHRFQGTIRVNK